jgi:hypothetical protein
MPVIIFQSIVMSGVIMLSVIKQTVILPNVLTQTVIMLNITILCDCVSMYAVSGY